MMTKSKVIEVDVKHSLNHSFSVEQKPDKEREFSTLNHFVFLVFPLAFTHNLALSFWLPLKCEPIDKM